jgi:hypothetical protein
MLGAAAKRRWLLAFAVGLMHGFGFSLDLRDRLQFAGRHVQISLLAVDLGSALAQLLVVVALVAVLWLLYNYLIAKRIGAVLLSAFVAHAAWHWVIERGGRLWLYDIRGTLPGLSANLLAAPARWGGLMLIVATLAWVMSVVYSRMEQGGGTEQSSS